MMKKQVLVDMDGVLADVYTQFRKYEKQESGLELSIDDLVGKLELEAFPNGKKHVNSRGFFRSVPTIKGSYEGLKYLNDRHDVLVVSSATEFPESLKEKLEWLNEHYPFISWRQMIFCGEKKAVKGDIMIDDHMKNLRHFDGKRILFSQPHNLLINENSFMRVGNWKEIVEYFEGS